MPKTSKNVQVFNIREVRDGKTALDWALEMKHVDVAEVIKSAQKKTVEES